MKKLISITDITGYMYCPRKLWFKLQGFKEPPTQKMISGFLKHKAFDIFNKNESIIVSSINQKIKQEEIKKLYQNNLLEIAKEVLVNYDNQAKSFGINEQDFLKQILKISEPEIKLRIESISQSLEQGFLGKELWRNLKPKYLSEFEIISSELGLKGRVDRVKLQDEIIPYELKTREEIYESDKIQLAAYALLLEQEFSKPVNLGIVETASQSQEVILDNNLKNKVLELAEKIRNLAEPSLPSNFNKCQNCSFRKECYDED
ncbi:MAG: CRISPR-associated protein Cas4 [Candidatus Pacearchaeota archaeon]|nr:CRISPR-associated protein Cas4 [Candidatus Pacearchaeota archaeon]